MITLAVILAVLIVGPMVAWGWAGDGPGAGGAVLLVLVVVGVVLLLRRDERPASGPEAPNPSASTSTTDSGEPTSAGVSPAASTVSSQTAVLPVDGTPPGSPPALAPPTAAYPPGPPQPPKERSVLGRLTVGVALLVAGSLIALDVADVIVVEPVVVLASALAVVALGLLVGTIVGRSRGLIALGIVLVFLLIPVGAAPEGLRVGGGAGERLYQPTSQSELSDRYELGVGELTVDLSKVDVVGTEDDRGLGRHGRGDRPAAAGRVGRRGRRRRRRHHRLPHRRTRAGRHRRPSSPGNARVTAPAPSI